jgi:hypothetical protein
MSVVYPQGKSIPPRRCRYRSTKDYRETQDNQYHKQPFPLVFLPPGVKVSLGIPWVGSVSRHLALVQSGTSAMSDKKSDRYEYG